MDDWDMLPDDRDYRLMAEEFAKLKVRRDVVETGVGLPDYSKEYAESCYYTQCAIDSLIRYYFERSGERGEVIPHLAAISAKQVIKLKDICKQWFGYEPDGALRAHANMSRAACRQRLIVSHSALLATLFKIDDICGSERRETLRGVIDRAIACAVMCMSL